MAVSRAPASQSVRGGAAARAAPPLKKRVRQGLRRLTPYLFIAPALFFYCGFVVYPMLNSLAISFTDWDGLSQVSKFVGFDNYRKIFSDPVAVLALKNNLLWTLVMLTVPTVLGLLLALGLNRKFRGATMFRSFFYAPSILPLVGVAGLWAWMFDPTLGLVNTTLHKIGLGAFAHQWLGDPNTALFAVMVAAIWHGVGFPMVLYLAGLQGIPHEQYEAARIDGARPWRQFRHITMPWLAETHIIVVTLLIISSFKVFDMIYSMTYGGPGQTTQVLASWMYFQTFQFYHAGYGSALTWMIALILIVVTIPYIRIMSRRSAA
jgi:raffinose/stachyose/melibiose transport system permease protein